MRQTKQQSKEVDKLQQQHRYTKLCPRCMLN